MSSEPNSNVKIPTTREEAIEAIAALDAAKWSEAERETSRNMHRSKSLGLLLNTLAHRPEYDYGNSVPHLVAAAKQALTEGDRCELSRGG